MSCHILEVAAQDRNPSLQVCDELGHELRKMLRLRKLMDDGLQTIGTKKERD